MEADEKELRRILRRLTPADRQTLLRFARFLATSEESGDAGQEVPEPRHVAPAADETVVGAIKRLSSTYHMLDKAKMLNETSVLVAEHTIQGRPREEVIEKLEIVFRRHYERLLEANGGNQ